MKRVLVTGATGFVGRHSLQPLLERGYEVHAVTRDEPVGSAPEVHWHRADLLDAERADALVAELAPTHLLHFAWYVAPGKYLSAPENLAWVGASLRLAERFVRAGGRRLVVAGTCFEYDPAFGYCSEALTPLVPTSLYGTCKASLYAMLRAFAEQEGVSSAWGRIFFLYGPHEAPGRLVPAVIRSLLAGEPARCSHGRQIRDFLHVADVAEGFVALLDSEVTGAVNIASGEPVELREIVRRIGEQIGRPALVQLGALPARPDEPPLLLGNAQRLRDQVEWSPRMDLDTGLAQTIEWWRAAAR